MKYFYEFKQCLQPKDIVIKEYTEKGIRKTEKKRKKKKQEKDRRHFRGIAETLTADPSRKMYKTVLYFLNKISDFFKWYVLNKRLYNNYLVSCISF